MFAYWMIIIMISLGLYDMIDWGFIFSLHKRSTTWLEWFEINERIIFSIINWKYYRPELVWKVFFPLQLFNSEKNHKSTRFFILMPIKYSKTNGISLACVCVCKCVKVHVLIKTNKWCCGMKTKVEIYGWFIHVIEKVF